MPSAIKTPCRHPGCGVPCHGGYCDQHQRDWRTSDARRGTPAQRGYDDAWKRVAQARRELVCYLCQTCLNQLQRLTPAKIVDHILPIHVRPDLRLELTNLQTLCPACHQRKTRSDLMKYGSATRRNRRPVDASAPRPYPRTHRPA
jgi:5-methylcytosine-specific restriction protein A